MTNLETNLRSIQARISAAASRAGRSPAEITLVAVTKTQSPKAIQAAYDLGLRHFGENRAEEAETKIPHLPEDIAWHMIGHIQSRKAKRVIPLFRMIHSLDSVKLAQRLDRLGSAQAGPLPVLLECNVSGEDSKYGFPAYRWAENGDVWSSLLATVEEILELPCLEVQGLMTMAPIVPQAEQARPVFSQLRLLRDSLAVAFPQIEWQHLSMGMTDDFEVAIEEGATLIRVGRAIFSPGVSAWRKG
jgi:pyridoxal phosphate enzyme (YggS family)